MQIWSKETYVLKTSKINSSPLGFCRLYSKQKEKVTDEELGQVRHLRSGTKPEHGEALTPCSDAGALARRISGTAESGRSLEDCLWGLSLSGPKLAD